MTSLPPLVPGFTLSEWFHRAELVLLSPVRVCIALSVGPTDHGRKFRFYCLYEVLGFLLGLFWGLYFNFTTQIFSETAGAGDLNSSRRNQISQAPR